MTMVVSGQGTDSGDTQGGRRAESAGRRRVGAHLERYLTPAGIQAAAARLQAGTDHRGLEQIEDAVVFHLPRVLVTAPLVRVETLQYNLGRPLLDDQGDVGVK